MWLLLLFRVLDLKPTSVHERCPIILGSTSDVEHVLSFYAPGGSAAAAGGAAEEGKA